MALSTINNSGLAAGTARANFGAGAVLQVLQATKTDTTSTTSTDYAEYLKWLAEGNTPLPADTQPEQP